MLQNKKETVKCVKLQWQQIYSWDQIQAWDQLNARISWCSVIKYSVRFMMGRQKTMDTQIDIWYMGDLAELYKECFFWIQDYAITSLEIIILWNRV